MSAIDELRAARLDPLVSWFDVYLLAERIIEQQEQQLGELEARLANSDGLREGYRNVLSVAASLLGLGIEDDTNGPAICQRIKQQEQRLAELRDAAKAVAERQPFLSNPIRCAFCNKDFYNDETTGKIKESHFTDCDLVALRSALRTREQQASRGYVNLWLR